MPTRQIDKEYVRAFFGIDESPEGDEELDAIGAKLERLQFRSGQDICTIDGEPDGMYFLESGTAVVLDREGDLRGVLSLGDILKYCLPEHLLWMDNLSPIDRLQPFADMLKSASDAKVADLMHTEFVAVEKDAPAIQLAKLFTQDQLRQLVITDGGRFVGVVEIKKFCSRIFWE